jgi:hypothetical protein
MTKTTKNENATGLQVSTPTKNDFIAAVTNATDLSAELFEMAEQIQENELDEVSSSYKEFNEGDRQAFIFLGIEEVLIQEEIKKIVVLQDKHRCRCVNANSVLVNTFSIDTENKKGKMFIIECLGKVKTKNGSYNDFKILTFNA